MALTTSQIANLKSKAQRMEPAIKIGKEGLTEAFLKSLAGIFDKHELIKVKFASLKEDKKRLTPELAERSGSILVTRVGNVVVLYKEHPDPARRKWFVD